MEHLDILESWLGSLAADAKTFSAVMTNEKIPEDGRRLAAGVINYLFKSLDLIPDGIDDIGYLDDVLTLRIGASLLDREEIEKVDSDLAGKIKTIADDSPTAREILGDDIYERFRTYANLLPNRSSRGRSAAEIISIPQKLNEVRMEVGNFCKEYTAPRFEKSERVLTRLKSFLDTRLPR